MKKYPECKSPSRLTPAALRGSILTGLIVASASVVLTAAATAQTTTNPFGTIFHTVDGTFTPGGEWSDVTPQAFISNPGQSAIPTTISNPAANSLLYAGLGRTSAVSDISLFLMYDFVPRTTAPNLGEVFATVAFPINLPFTVPPLLGGPPVNVPGGGTKQNINVLFIGQTPAQGFFDVFVDLDFDGVGDFKASQFGIIGATQPGSSPLSATPHLRAELQVPLRIPVGFSNSAPGSPLPGGGINPSTGLYDPDPAFWGAAGAGDGGPIPPPSGTLQPATAGTIGINPNGSVFVAVVPVPEPATAVWGFACALAFFGRQRSRAA